MIKTDIKYPSSARMNIKKAKWFLIWLRLIMIPHSNTIIDPWAVMVKSVNTSLAYVTMSTSRSSNDFTFWT